MSFTDSTFPSWSYPADLYHEQLWAGTGPRWDAIYQVSLGLARRMARRSLGAKKLAKIEQSYPLDALVATVVTVGSVDYVVRLSEPTISSLGFRSIGPPGILSQTIADDYISLEWRLSVGIRYRVPPSTLLASDPASSQPSPLVTGSFNASRRVVAAAVDLTATASNDDSGLLFHELRAGRVTARLNHFLHVEDDNHSTSVHASIFAVSHKWESSSGSLNLQNRSLDSIVKSTLDENLVGVTDVKISPTFNCRGHVHPTESRLQVDFARSDYRIRQRPPVVTPIVAVQALAESPDSGRGGGLGIPVASLGTADSDEYPRFLAPEEPINDSTAEYICIGINFTGSTDQPSLNSVPFALHDANFALILHEDTIVQVIQTRWDALDWPRAAVFDHPFELSSPESEEPVVGVSRLLFRIQGVPPTVDLQARDGPSDSISVDLTMRVQMQELWQGGKNVTGDLEKNADTAHLLDPVVTDLRMNIRVFDVPSVNERPGEAFLNGLGSELMASLYTPTSEAFAISAVAGTVSASERRVEIRGRLA